MVLFPTHSFVDRTLDDAVDSLGGDFWLIDRRHRLHGLIHFIPRPAKLGGVHPRQLDHGQLDVAFSCISSVRTASVKPRIAALAPQ
ncbi:Uncharacterised protein [Klebsiella variicola]|nr:Uncharacterised protein [Klebsiella variicola]